LPNDFFGSDEQIYIDAICQENINLLKTRFDVLSASEKQSSGFDSHCDLLYTGDRLIIPVI
jgi:hypothetical protein